MSASPLAPSAVSPAVQKRLTSTLFVLQSLASATIIAAFTLTPIMATTLSGDPRLAGVPLTLSMLGRAFSAYPLGWLMDRRGRRIGIVTGFGLIGLGMGVSALAIGLDSFLVFCVGALLAGTGQAVTEQSRYIAAEIYPKADRARAIGFVVFAGTVGAVGGPLLVTPSAGISALFGLGADAGPYTAGVVMTGLAMLIAFSLLRPDPQQLGRMVQAEEDADNARQGLAAAVKRPVGEILRQRPVQLALASMAIGQMVMTLLMVITPVHMHDHHHGHDAVSLVIMAHTLGMFGFAWLTGILIDKLGRIPMIIIGALVLVLSAILTPVSTEVPILATALFLLGIGWNFCFVAGSSLLSDSLNSLERGRIQGVSETIVALSSGTGSLSTGSFFALGGITAVASIGLAFSLALAALTFLRRERLPVAEAGD